jgi:hypothetical protein
MLASSNVQQSTEPRLLYPQAHPLQDKLLQRVEIFLSLLHRCLFHRSTVRRFTAPRSGLFSGLYRRRVWVLPLRHGWIGITENRMFCSDVMAIQEFQKLREAEIVFEN